MKNDKMEIPELTKMSSRGQIVIPRDVRKRLNVKKGTVFAVTAKKDLIVMKKIDRKMTKEDLETLKSVEEAWREIEEGKSESFTLPEFFGELNRMKKSLKK